jgi:hypothetical protein
MMIHDENVNVEQKIEQISEYGYELLGYFILDVETWRVEYFTPLQKLVDETEKKYGDIPEVHKELLNARQELEIFEESPERNSSVCFVIRKK